ncbi:odorant receptor 49b-like [Culicoides brevitarsis]|uniref:odorant receptor 49b-like n=1 Tax=Culicoides brevitarsis TaxID=469753 RepID=UPI00307B71A9
MLTLLFVGASTLQVEILRTEVQQLEQLILLNMQDNEKTVKKHFAKIIDLHNDVIEYASNAEYMLSFQYFLDVTTLTVLVVIALFYARLANWIPGYVLAVVVLFAALLNYGLGELNSIQLHKLQNDIYNVSWFRMSIGMQKMLLIFLQKSSTNTFFTCGGLRPINVDLFASFCNSVYSYLIIIDNMQAKIGIKA